MRARTHLRNSKLVKYRKISCVIYGGERKLQYILLCYGEGTESYYLSKTRSEMCVSFFIFKLNTSQLTICIIYHFYGNIFSNGKVVDLFVDHAA